MQYAKRKSGLVVPVPKPEPDPKPKPKEHPKKEGWEFSMCDDRYFDQYDEEWRRDALERLYIMTAQQGAGPVSGEQRKTRARCRELVDELAVALVGGVPEGWEAFT